MGTLRNGLPYLTQRGLSKALGINQSTLSALTKEWRENHADPVIPPEGSRLGFLRHRLHKERFKGPDLYMVSGTGNSKHYAYPSVVCMALIEYYAFESKPPSEVVQRLSRRLAQFGFQEFVCRALRCSPEDPWNHFRDRVSLLRQLESALDGYFIVFDEMNGLMVGLIVAKLSVNHKTVLDISVGALWSKYWVQQQFDRRFGPHIRSTSKPLLVAISSHVRPSSRSRTVRSSWFHCTVQMSLGALRGQSAFLQGRVLGATSPRGPSVQARAVFGGGTPAPPAVRTRGPSRPGHLHHSLLRNWLDLLHSLRLGRLSRPGSRAPT